MGHTTEHERRGEDVQFRQLSGMVQRHHERLGDVEKTLSHTPDPETLRAVEHVFKELPSTDDLKDCVKARGRRAAMFKRVAWGVTATVCGTLALALMSLIWQGITLSLTGSPK